MPDRRPIPDRGMPHRVTISPCTGYSAQGPVWGPPGDVVRANLNGGGTTRSGGTITGFVGGAEFSMVRSGEVVLDDVELPLLSLVTNEATGNSGVVGSVTRFDQAPMQSFIVATLGELVA